MYAKARNRILKSARKHASYLPRFLFAIDKVSHTWHFYLSGQISLFILVVVIEVAVDEDFGFAHHFAQEFRSWCSPVKHSLFALGHSIGPTGATASTQFGLTERPLEIVLLATRVIAPAHILDQNCIATLNSALEHGVLGVSRFSSVRHTVYQHGKMTIAGSPKKTGAEHVGVARGNIHDFFNYRLACISREVIAVLRM